MTPLEIELFFKRFEDSDPDPQTELASTNAYTLLVAVALSAQATDKSVNKATEPLFEFIKTPQDMLDYGEEALREAIKTIGLFRTKAKNIIALSARLVTHYNGTVPQTREELVTLPGVGRKTANVVLNAAFGHPTLAVDTHIFRLAHRTGLSSAKTTDGVEQDLLRVIPDTYKRRAHYWLVLHGRYICKARKPLCHECPVNDLCAYGKAQGFGTS
jgi:endonuclease-3